MFRKTHGDDPNKLLFLDIDGVLNSSAFFEYSKQYKKEKIVNKKSARQYDLKKLELLKEIHNKTKCTIVMSSSWRSFYFRKDACIKFKKDLKKRGIIIRYKTSNNYDKDELFKQSGIGFIKNKNGTYNSKYIPKNEKPKLTKFYERGYQINEFLTNWKKKYPNVKFSILDDDCGDLVLFGDNFVNTKWYGEIEEECGLTKETTKKVIDILNKE